jgi:carotenoid cleavage dioxygenase-like enzyme
MHATMNPVDPATEPFLTGRFAAIHDELDVADLEIEGTLPTDLVGAYLRNGPNPEFTPLGSYTYPLEGDGMLHGLWFDNGTARYANRFVRTQSLLAEERAGRALFGGLMTPAFVDQSLLGDDPDPGWPFKLDAFVNIVRHGGRYLALEEGAPAYEIEPTTLATGRRCDWNGALPAGITAHPKIDPVTGEMIVFRYGMEAPFLTWATIGADGTVTQPPVAVDGVDQGFMIHDFAITRRYVVLVISPLLFDLEAMFHGGSPLDWQPDLGTRIAIIPRDRSGASMWAHTNAFWAWHYANAFDDGPLVHLDFPCTSAPKMALRGADIPDLTGGFARATINPAADTVDVHLVDANMLEYPRIDDRLTGLRHRYLVIAGRSADARVKLGEHDQLYQYDMDAGTSVRIDTGAAAGEPVFAPRTASTDELDGYYLAYATDLETDRTSLLVIDASDFAAGPVAKVHLPRRVPNGLHGNWIPVS